MAYLLTLFFVLFCFLIKCVSESKSGPPNIGNVISQILLCKAIAPDWNQEETNSVAKDSQDVIRILRELQEFMPQQETSTGNSFSFLHRG